MTPQSLLPDSWVLVTGLFYWLPGETISSKIWKIKPPKYGRSWHLLFLTPCLLAIYSFLQANSGMVHEGKLLLQLSVSCMIGACSYIVCSGERLFNGSERSSEGLRLYSCILFAYYVWFLTLIWWLPAGVRSIWIWPLQFEPRLVTGVFAIIAIAVSLLSTNTQISTFRRIGISMMGCLIWQVCGIYGKSLSIGEIALSEKITGYLGASRLFSSTYEIAQSYIDRIGLMPFHVNTHPAGKVLLMKLLDELDASHAPILWALVISICVCLIVPLSYKVARLLSFSKNHSALVGTSVSIMPSLALFCPGFDAYNAFLCTLLLLLWIKGLLRSKSKGSLTLYSFSIGIIGYSAVTFSYTSLVFGSVLIAWSPWIVGRYQLCSSWRRGCMRVLAIAFASGTVAICADMTTHYLTGYSNLFALSKSMEIQTAIEATNRAGLNAFLLDWADFAYGMSPVLFAGFLLISSGVVVRLAFNLRRNRQGTYVFRDIEHLMALTFASIVGVALSGLLDIETARVWLMLMVPATISTTLWAVVNHEVNVFRSFLFCQAIWGATLVLRYQFLF